MESIEAEAAMECKCRNKADNLSIFDMGCEGGGEWRSSPKQYLRPEEREEKERYREKNKK
jgi:hypothetical protein